MKRTILLLFMVVAISAVARPNVTSYLYELNGNVLKQIKQSDIPIIRQGNAQDVINLDKGEVPTQEQLDNLKANIQARQVVEAEKSLMRTNPKAYILKVMEEKVEPETVMVIK